MCVSCRELWKCIFFPSWFMVIFYGFLEHFYTLKSTFSGNTCKNAGYENTILILFDTFSAKVDVSCGSAATWQLFSSQNTMVLCIVLRKSCKNVAKHVVSRRCSRKNVAKHVDSVSLFVIWGSFGHDLGVIWTQSWCFHREWWGRSSFSIVKHVCVVHSFP